MVSHGEDLREGRHPRALRAVQALLIALCLALSGSAIFSALQGRQLPLLLACCLWLPLAWGLWRRHALARRVAVGLLWLVVVFLPLGIINPFAVIDGAVARDTPPWPLILPVLAVLGVALLMIHVLDTYRAHFGRKGNGR